MSTEENGLLEKAILWFDHNHDRYRVDVYKIRNKKISDRDILDACQAEALGSWEATAVLDSLDFIEKPRLLVKQLKECM